MWKAMGLGGGTVLALLAAWLLLQIAARRPKLPPPLPVPNGYDAFVQAGMVVSRDAGLQPNLKPDDLRGLVASNREALQWVRTGLTQRCLLPPSYATNYHGNFASNLMQQLPAFKCVAQALAAEGRLAEIENRPADAARSYLDCIRFGNEQSRGGPLISRLVGLAGEAIGYQPLLGILPKLSPTELRELTHGLEEVRRDSVPWEAVWRAERGYIAQFTRNPFAWVINYPQIVPAKLKAQQKDAAIRSRLTLLSVELALRCYQTEHGNPPAQLKELTPKFLKEIPLDPFSGKPLVYRLQGTNWALYSVGPDRVDNGGVSVVRRSQNQVANGPPFFSISVPAGDVFYDSVW